MTIATEFSVTKNGSAYDIRHVGGASCYTVLELHQWLGTLSDDAAWGGDDQYDITIPKLSERSTDEIIALLNGANIDDTASQFFYGGSISQAGGDTLYSGLIIVGTVQSGTQPVLIQNNVILTDFWGTSRNPNPAAGQLFRFLVKSRDAGADIDGKRLRVRTLELSDSFSYFDTLLGTANATAAIGSSDDINNQTAAGTIAGWNDITYVGGLRSIDLGNGAGAKDYLDEWDFGSRTEAQFYERTKWLQRRGSASTIHGINGQLYMGITHWFNYDTEVSGGLVNDEVATWGSGATAGTGLILAIKDNGATGVIYMQLLTGVAPTAATVITGGSGTVAVNGSVTQKVPSSNFVGQYTGAGLIGAYSVGVQSADLTVSDSVQPLVGAAQSPPNDQSGVVSGLTSTEDYVLVVESTGDGSTVFKYNQLGSAAGNNITDPDFVCDSAIPSDTPVSGTFRAWCASTGTFDKLYYSSWIGSTFTLDVGQHPTGLPHSYTNGDDAFITYIDKLAVAASASFTAVYSAPKYMAVLVRDGGATPKKEFLSPATFGPGGFSITDTAIADV